LAVTAKSVGTMSTTCTGWHLPPTHAPPRQLWPQAPQLAALVDVFTHAGAADGLGARAHDAVAGHAGRARDALAVRGAGGHACGGAADERAARTRRRAGHAPAPLQPAIAVSTPLAQLGWRQTVRCRAARRLRWCRRQLPLQGAVPAQAVWPVRGLPVT
jgi:hypothetical protein